MPTLPSNVTRVCIRMKLDVETESDVGGGGIVTMAKKKKWME
jgi:hypothetical protein